jgi:hypothetical protein
MRQNWPITFAIAAIRRKWRIEVRLITSQSEPIVVDLFMMATHDVEQHALQFRTAMLDVTLRKVRKKLYGEVSPSLNRRSRNGLRN